MEILKLQLKKFQSKIRIKNNHFKICLNLGYLIKPIDRNSYYNKSLAISRIRLMP